MKLKSIIKLICLLLVMAVFAVWAFAGTSFPIFTFKLKSWDQAMNKGYDLGQKYSIVYSIAAPKDSKDFDVLAETKNAVEVIGKRVEILGYESYAVRRIDNNKVLVELAFSEMQLRAGLESIFENNGKLEVKSGSTVLFNNNDVVSASRPIADETGSKCYVEIKLNDAAKQRLKDATSNGAYTYNVTLDESVVKNTFKGSEPITNGILKLEFDANSYTDALTLAYCVDTGYMNGTITEMTDLGRIIEPAAQSNAISVLGWCLLAMLVLAAVYFAVANKLTGVGAILSVFAGVIIYMFFAATFTGFIVNAWAVAGLAVGIAIIVIAHVFVMNGITQQFANGKDASSAIKGGFNRAKVVLAELLAVPAVLGFGLWFCGDGVKDFGLAILAGSIVAYLAAVLLFRFMLSLMAGVSENNLKALGFKRGE